MWYFAWVLGLFVAAGFAILNAMWLEMCEDDDERDNGTPALNRK